MAIYGTRPEAIKMAPLVIALRDDPRFEVRVVVTGQHREMLDQVNQSFGIVPDRDNITPGSIVVTGNSVIDALFITVASRPRIENPARLAAGRPVVLVTAHRRESWGEIVDAVSTLIEDERTYQRMARALNPYGDGHAAERTVRALARHYGHDDTVQEFHDWAAAVPVA